MTRRDTALWSPGSGGRSVAVSTTPQLTLRPTSAWRWARVRTSPWRPETWHWSAATCEWRRTAFAVTEVVKKMMAEVQPWRSLPHAYFVDACPAPPRLRLPRRPHNRSRRDRRGALPVDRRLSAIAAIFAVPEGFTRVYACARYPRDVLGAAVFALPVAFLASLCLPPLGGPATVP